ncbi:MAG: hypothetical protein V7K47_20810 [Nostoc sp.]
MAGIYSPVGCVFFALTPLCHWALGTRYSLLILAQWLISSSPFYLTQQLNLPDLQTAIAIP